MVTATNPPSPIGASSQHIAAAPVVYHDASHGSDASPLIRFSATRDRRLARHSLWLSCTIPASIYQIATAFLRFLKASSGYASPWSRISLDTNDLHIGRRRMKRWPLRLGGAITTATTSFYSIRISLGYVSPGSGASPRTYYLPVGDWRMEERPPVGSLPALAIISSKWRQRPSTVRVYRRH